MPISLEAISRRHFLQTSFALGAAAVPHGALAALKSPDYDHISLLSDVHVSGRGAGKMGERLTQAIDGVLRLPTPPDKVLIAGDCAYLRGKRDDYREYVRLIQPLIAARLPLHMTLGNHDHRDNFWDALPSKHTAGPIGIERQAAIVPGRRANWFLLDSLHKTNEGEGELGSDQLQWLAAGLDQNAAKPALIMLHHNPDRDFDGGSLKDSKALMSILRPRRNVKAIFFGHTHIWSVTQDRCGIHMVNLPATGYTLFLRSFIGWVDCQVYDRGAALRVHALDRGEKEDGRVVKLGWRA